MPRSPNQTGIDVTRELIDAEVDDSTPFLTARVPGASDGIAMYSDGRILRSGTDIGTLAHSDLGYWFQDNAAADQSAVALNLDGGTSRSALPMLRAGSVTGVVVRSNEARTAGTLTVEVTKNGTGTGLTAVLNGTNTTVKATTQAAGTDTFVAGDTIGVTVTTDSAWLPVTADITVVVEITG